MNSCMKLFLGFFTCLTTILSADCHRSDDHPIDYTRPISEYNFRFLTYELDYVDGRPVFSADGHDIVFMRQANDGNPNSLSQLYIIAADGSKKAKLLLRTLNPNTNQPFNATRPDFSWKRETFQIAFDAGNEGIWIFDICSQKVRQVLQTTIGSDQYSWSYPAWFPDGKYLSVTNYNTFGEPLYHQLVKAHVSHLNQFVPITNNLDVWPGESSVNQRRPSLLTYAGQAPVPQPPPACTCDGGCLSDGYAQNCNQIWLQKGSVTAPIDQEQGRAPWFSPDGKHIVFESNRDNPSFPESYQLFVYSLQHNTVRAITPPALNVQHGKWSPDGKHVAFACHLVGGANGIAIVDLEGSD